MWEDADGVYYEYRVMKNQLEESLLSGWVERIFLNWSIGYGVRPFYAIPFALGWIVFFFFLFTILHWSAIKQDAKPALEFFAYGSLKNFLFGADLPIVIEPSSKEHPTIEFKKTALVRSLLVLERLIGWYTVLMFVLALGRQLIR
jgi:hypothetical protein